MQKTKHPPAPPSQSLPLSGFTMLFQRCCAPVKVAARARQPGLVRTYNNRPSDSAKASLPLGLQIYCDAAL